MRRLNLLNQMGDGFVPTGKVGLHLLLAALSAPRLILQAGDVEIIGPIIMLDDANEIDQLAAAQPIGDTMAPPPHPHTRGWGRRVIAEFFNRHSGPPRRIAGKHRMVGAK